MRPKDSNEPALHPYQHQHTEVEEIPWSRLGHLLTALLNTVQQSFRPELVVGIAKGGVIPAVYASSAFGVDVLPIKLSSRKNERIISETPIWHVYPTDQVRGRRVLLVDDICVAGRTLRMATDELHRRGATAVRTATLAVHHASVRPDFCILETDALVLWPWDRDVLQSDGTWRINPEYLEEMNQVQGYKPAPAPAREPLGRWQ